MAPAWSYPPLDTRRPPRSSAVRTRWPIQTDTWTLAAGLSAKDSYGGEFHAGLGVSYLESGDETQYAPGLNSAVDSGWAYAASLSYKVKW